MGTLIEKIQRALDTKEKFKSKFADKGVTISDSLIFNKYPDKLNSISGEIPEDALQEKIITPTNTNQNIVPDQGYVGLSRVTVQGDANLDASNIKNGVSIFGVTGTMEVGGYTGDSTDIIHDMMFVGRLTEIDLSSFNGGNLQPYAFAGKHHLSKVTLPEDTHTIGSYAFYYCSNLKSISIPSSCSSLGAECFARSGLEEINIPSSVSTLGQRCFAYCNSLKELIIPESVTSYIDGIAISCTSLERISLPDNWTKLYDTFSGCTSLKHVKLPANLQDMNSYGIFRNCPSLTEVTIPVGVTIIGSSSLQPGSETNKATIIMLPTTPPAIQSSTFNKNYLNKIIVPFGCGDIYKAASVWSTLADYIEEADE